MLGPWNALFWDLDGTITDPMRGITGAYQELLNEYGVAPKSTEELLWVIGPPLRECLPQLIPLKTPQDIEEAVVRYRHWYVTQELMYLDTPYPGIRELLQDLKQRGTPMYVATAKAHPYARKILEHWNLDSFFIGIHGSELDGTRSLKADLLDWMLERYQLSPSKSIAMIGDRKHDMIAGQAHGLATIGVGYGYGSKAELTNAAADLYVQDLTDLRKALIL